MKAHFTKEDYERALGSVFFNKPFVISTFKTIFSKYPPGALANMSPLRLENTIRKITKMSEVKELQDIVQSETIDGENTLHHLSMTIFAQMQKLGIAPQKKEKVYPKSYQDIWAYCRRNNTRIARGLFEPSLSLENIFFTPENTYYSELSRVFRGGELVCEHGSDDITLRRAAALHVYRDYKTDEGLTTRVRTIIQATADRLYGTAVKSKAKRYEAAEKIIIDDKLYPTFKSLRTGNKVNYTKVYKIFESIIRENVDTLQLNFDPELRKVLNEEIQRVVPLPYAVIRTRVKERESEYGKLLRALYNIKTGDEKSTSKKLEDRYGLRFIVPSVDAAYSLVRAIEGIVGLEVIDCDDYIKEPKPNGYRSYHMAIRVGGTTYDFQIRTHKMDRDAELSPSQAHDKVLVTKKDSLKIIPDQVKTVVRAVYLVG